MVAQLRYISQILRHLGLSWAIFRVVYALQLRVGYLRRRLPSSSWDNYPLSRCLSDSNLADSDRYQDYRQHRSPPFFFDISERPSYQSHLLNWDRLSQEKYPSLSSPIQLVAEVEQGIYRYFSHKIVKGAFAPDWHTNPWSNISTPTDQHWTQIGDFGSGDIKIIWEQSRFGFAYTLVRAYWRTGNNKYAELFWKLFEDWYQYNPPLQGVNWKCGQEISFRVMAWCFALYGFFDAPATTPARLTKLAQAIALSGERIALNVNYALSQRNNHGISEALGLWTIGVLFPEFKSAVRWEKIGRTELERQGRTLIYDDGAFSQDSVNYHRVMLHDYLWGLRLGDILQQPFTEELKQRVAKAGDLLYQLQDIDSGHLPCHGANDGALILPLNNCDYLDFRPIVQSIHYLTHNNRCFPADIQDEDLLWFFGLTACMSPVEPLAQVDLVAKNGGYYTIRKEKSFVFTRCTKFRDRPSHADLLHLDLWWKGQNIVIDPGTYSYNALPPWDRGLECTAYHNTVTVDGLDQMERASKFLWLPWAEGKELVRQYDESGKLQYWEGTHDGYQRLPVPVNHRRGILSLDDESWLILDRLTSSSNHQYALQWLFPDYEYQYDPTSNCLKLDTPQGEYFVNTTTSEASAQFSLVSADPNSPRGWKSHYYYDRSPALSLQLTTTEQTTLFCTLFSPRNLTVLSSENSISIQYPTFTYGLNLETNPTTAIIQPHHFK